MEVSDDPRMGQLNGTVRLMTCLQFNTAFQCDRMRPSSDANNRSISVFTPSWSPPDFRQTAPERPNLVPALTINTFRRPWHDFVITCGKTHRDTRGNIFTAQAAPVSFSLSALVSRCQVLQRIGPRETGHPTKANHTRNRRNCISISPAAVFFHMTIVYYSKLSPLLTALWTSASSQKDRGQYTVH